MSLTRPEFSAAFLRYWTDNLFEPVILDVRAEFLEMTGRKMLRGVPYTVICLILAQAMQRMLDGYSGHHSSSNLLLHEAVGFSNGFTSNVLYARLSAHKTDRYTELDGMINQLQKEDPKFANLIERVLSLDRVATEPVVTCKHCKAKLTKVGNQWHSVLAVLPQYCWVDPAKGSQVHEP